MRGLAIMKFPALLFIAISIGGCSFYSYPGMHYPGIQKDYDIFLEKKTEFPISYRVQQSDPDEARASMSPSVYIKPAQGSHVSNVNGWRE